MNFVKPIKITSPISGQLTAPRIIEKIVDGKLVKEAHWYDPASGTFIRKGVISVEEIKQDKSA